MFLNRGVIRWLVTGRLTPSGNTPIYLRRAHVTQLVRSGIVAVETGSCNAFRMIQTHAEN